MQAQEDVPEVPIQMFVLYRSPSDIPERWVIRKWLIVPGEFEPVPGPLLAVTATREEAIAALEEDSPGLTFIPPRPDDDRTVDGVWM
jgi:hypothetical protein